MSGFRTFTIVDIRRLEIDGWSVVWVSKLEEYAKTGSSTYRIVLRKGEVEYTIIIRFSPEYNKKFLARIRNNFTDDEVWKDAPQNVLGYVAAVATDEPDGFGEELGVATIRKLLRALKEKFGLRAIVWSRETGSFYNRSGKVKVGLRFESLINDVLERVR